MQVIGEVFQRVPLLEHLKAPSQAASTGKLRVDHRHGRLLLRPVNDKLTADHVDVRITLARRLRFPGFTRTMKSVRRAMEPDVSFAILYGIKKRLLSLLGHRLAAIFRIRTE